MNTRVWQVKCRTVHGERKAAEDRAGLVAGRSTGECGSNARV